MAGEPAADHYRAVRGCTAALCAPLAVEDHVAQSMPEASPAKWHLAHTSWFFERFVLEEAGVGYRCFDPTYEALFNSYYQSIGPTQPRAMRGLMTRPTLQEIHAYREYVDEHMQRLLDAEASSRTSALAGRVQLGLNHEQQHQELLLTDILHLLSMNPLRPPYRAQGLSPAPRAAVPAPAPPRWCHYEARLHQSGADGTGFSFDNERPRHARYCASFALAQRLVANGEYRDFVRDGGYQRATLWLSDGWPLAQQWQRPLYWDASLVSAFTLAGEQPLDPAAPVCHLSYYEADAFARWAGARLPTEFEWELAAEAAWEPVAAGAPLEGNFLEEGALAPRPALGEAHQLFGDVWEWTASAYLPYPGFQPLGGALGEYNGKFMANQCVLRGGSCATPRSHIRPTYRNFFPPQSRWQFAGVRLAKDLS